MLLVLLSLLVREAQAEPKDEARRHFSEGLELIAAGDYDEGIEAFEKAYELVPHPSVLYNIARAYADAGDYENALLYFELYLDTEPPDREEVEGYVALLHSRLGDGGAVDEEPSGVGPVATGDEVEELRRHADELAELAERLAEREASTPVPGGELALPSSGGLEGALVEDLFAREIVTASNFGQDPIESPSAITVITAEDIRLSGASSIPEVLALAPGMDVMALTAGQADVSIRGFNRRLSNKVLVLVDGRSIYLDFIGSVVWESVPVTLEEIERIEIIRGPGSAIYGANAFAGVVNIITKGPGDPATDSQITLSAGTIGTTRGAGVVSGRQRNLGYRASAQVSQKGRWAQEVDLAQRSDMSSDIPDQFTSVDVISGNVQLDWRLGGTSYASVNGGLSSGFYEFYSLGALRNFWLDARQVHLRGDAGYGPLHARVFYHGLVGDAGNWYYKTGGYNLRGGLDSDAVETTLGGYWALGGEGQHQLAVGVGYRFKSIAWDFISQDATQHHFNGYIQDQSDFGPFIVNAAARVDKHPLVTQPLPSARLALIGKLGPGRSLRVNVGTAFRTPNFVESYSFIPLGTDTDGIYALSHGDPALLPERIAAAELGFTDQHSDRWTAEFALYACQVDDLIELGALDTTAYPTEGFQESLGRYLAGETSFVNEANVFRAVGGELSAEFFGLEGLDIDGSYSYERIHQVDEGPVLSTPRHKLSGSVKYRSPYRIDLAMNAAWVSEQTWDVRGFDSSGQIAFVPTDVDDRFVLSNVLVLHVGQHVDISASAWNWLASIQGPTPQHPLGQPIGARYSGHLTYRF